MNWLRTHRRIAWICGLTLVVPLLLYMNALLALIGTWQSYKSDIHNVKPRLARMQGLIGYENRLRDLSARGAEEVTKLVYPASGDRATVSAALQTSVREILADAGLAVSNSQVLPIREAEKFDYISIRLTVEGELSGLDAALTAIARFRPLLLVESLEMGSVPPARGNPNTQIVTATLQLLSLRAVL